MIKFVEFIVYAVALYLLIYASYCSRSYPDHEPIKEVVMTPQDSLRKLRQDSIMREVKRHSDSVNAAELEKRKNASPIYEDKDYNWDEDEDMKQFWREFDPEGSYYGDEYDY